MCPAALVYSPIIEFLDDFFDGRSDRSQRTLPAASNRIAALLDHVAVPFGLVRTRGRICAPHRDHLERLAPSNQRLTHGRYQSADEIAASDARRRRASKRRCER
jgi:hypothetical protein